MKEMNEQSRSEQLYFPTIFGGTSRIGCSRNLGQQAPRSSVDADFPTLFQTHSIMLTSRLLMGLLHHFLLPFPPFFMHLTACLESLPRCRNKHEANRTPPWWFCMMDKYLPEFLSTEITFKVAGKEAVKLNWFVFYYRRRYPSSLKGFLVRIERAFQRRGETSFIIKDKPSPVFTASLPTTLMESTFSHGAAVCTYVNSAAPSN